MIWYFAYGSNMKESRLREREIQFQDFKIGYISNYTFRYNKIGSDKTGKGNIISSKGSKVWGVFFNIGLSDYRHLHINYEVGYTKINISGVSEQQTIKAKSFKAPPKNIDNTMTPSTEYYNIVLDGALEKGLPKEYINTLKR